MNKTRHINKATPTVKKENDPTDFSKFLAMVYRYFGDSHKRRTLINKLRIDLINKRIIKYAIGRAIIIDSIGQL